MLTAVRRRPAQLLALLVLAGAAGSAAAPACALGQAETLREALVGSRAKDGRDRVHAPGVARYVSQTGSKFILDRTGPFALFRLERQQEVWALRATPAPGGDVIYKNDLGQPVLRATRLGGLILFTPGEDFDSVPASLVGEVSPSRQPRVSLEALQQALQQAPQKIFNATKQPITVRFHAKGPTGSEFVFVDAIWIVTDTLTRIARLKEGKPYIRRLKLVNIRMGPRADARFHNGVLDVVVSPKDGVAGRPSSGRITRAIVGG